jgi:hypothetical protein
MHHSPPRPVTHSCGWPGTTRPPWLALQLLRTDDVGIPGIQTERRLHLPAPACAGRPALSGDLLLCHSLTLLWSGLCRSLLSRVAPERPGVVTASTRISARQTAILGYQLARTPTCVPAMPAKAAATLKLCKVWEVCKVGRLPQRPLRGGGEGGKDE